MISKDFEYMLKRKKTNKVKTIAIFLIVFVIGGLLIVKLRGGSQTSQKTALVSYVPNFDNLTLKDLPNFVNFIDVYEYDSHTLLIGNNRIVEYDEKTSKYIRVNDTTALPCIFDSAKIDNFLYVSCNGEFPGYSVSLPMDTKSLIASSIYKIDLASGKIVNQYFGEKIDLGPSFDVYSGSSAKTKGARANLRLDARGDTLWMSSWDGIEKMDTKTGKITVYSVANQILPGNELSGLNLNPDPSWYMTNPPANVPQFEHISQLKNNRYYLFASDGIYSLVKGEFPKREIEIHPSVPIFESEGKSTFTADGRYWLYVHPLFNVMDRPLVTEVLRVYLVDLEKNVATDLVNTPRFRVVLNNTTRQTIDSLGRSYSEAMWRGYFEEKDNVIFIKDIETKKVLLSVNLTQLKLDILK